MPELFWTLVLEDGWVQAGLWTVGESGVKVSAISPPSYWEEDEDLISSADSCLSSLVQDTSEDFVEPSKTVFGVPSIWVSEGQIKGEYLEKVRVLCSKLSLEPSGFVVLPEAIAYWVKSFEGSPLSGVVIGLGKDMIEVSVFTLGNLVGSVGVTRSVSLGDDVMEGLVRFKLDGGIPSRFLVYDGKGGELEEAKSKLMQVDWLGGSSKVKLLHLPKVEVIEAKEKVDAVSLSGASEIVGVTSLAPQPPRKKTFVEELDAQEQSNVVLVARNLGPEEIGFSVGRDIKEQTPIPLPSAPSISQVLKRDLIMGKIASLKAKLPKFNFGTSRMVLKGQGGNTRNLKIVAVCVLVLLVVGLLAWWFLPKAEVAVYVAPKKIEKAETVFVSPDATYNFGDKTLPGKVLEVDMEGDKTSSTTGSKLVGDRAKGKVQIRNGTSASVKLASGAALYGANDLKFVLDNSASVSAAVSPSSPGTVIVDATASDIGSQYNLAKGEVFSVTNYPKSDVDAVAEANFSGGASREIQAVSESDRTNLESDLIKELTEKGTSQLDERRSEDQVLVNGATVAVATSQDFSKKLGDEADNLKLSMKLSLSTLTLSKETLDKFSKELLANDVPSGFVLRDDQVKIEFEFVGVEDGVWQVNFKYTVNLLPEIKHNEIIQKIKGKSPSVAKEYLSSIPGFVRVYVTFKPSLPGFLQTLPRVANNISIEVASER